MRHRVVRTTHIHSPRALTDSHSPVSDTSISAATQMFATSVTGDAATIAVSDAAKSVLLQRRSKEPLVAIVAGSVVGGVALITLLTLLIWFWRRRRKRQLREPIAWTEEQMVSSSGLAGPTRDREMSTSEASPAGESGSHPSTLNSASSISDTPPQIPLTPGWPRRPISEKGVDGRVKASEKSKEARRGRQGARTSRLLDDTPFENILVEEEGETSGGNGRQTPSTVEAENGSVGHSTVPSRTASQRTHSSIRKVLRLSALTPLSWRRANRTRPSTPANTNTGTNETLTVDRHRSGVSSLWSWSHRATRSEYDNDGEPLPAYSMRRSQSTTRSGQRSRRSSATRFVAVAPEVNPPDYPVELARKVAQTYPRMPNSPGFPPPPFDGQENQGSGSQ